VPALLLSALLASAAGAECLPRDVAPGTFRNAPRTWGATDSGPIIDGFLELRRGDGLAPIEHGVDLSHHNTGIAYDELQRCGATFAFVKMDNMFSRHRQALEQRNIRVVPYFYLSVSNVGIDYKGRAGQFSGAAGVDLPADQMDALMRTARTMGQTKATQFISRYENALPGTPPTNLGGMTGRLVAVDVEEYLPPSSTSLQRRNFGRFYAAMLSTWVSDLRERYPDIIFIFYTFPAIYTDYLQYAYPADHAVIHGMPVWLARTRGDGSDLDLTRERNLQRICLSSSGGNRCILHQYSHRATFGFPAARGREVPLHLDVNRLFPTKQVSDSRGQQYVRAD
jgi:hypothetical protein